ncbi:MAG: hypothetical protein IIT49_01065, partial [Clostridia bacterium]|nr:hypothetical protein [Clostridia bacterium]
MTAGILTYFKGTLCAMTENMHADLLLSRQAVFVRCCLKILILYFFQFHYKFSNTKNLNSYLSTLKIKKFFKKTIDNRIGKCYIMVVLVVLLVVIQAIFSITRRRFELVYYQLSEQRTDIRTALQQCYKAYRYGG